MAELAEPDRQGVAVARHADVIQLLVGGVGAGGDGRHPAVNGIETVGSAQEIGRRLGGTADSADLGHPVGLDGQLEAGLDDGSGDRVMTAPGTQGGHAALVVSSGQSQCVLLEPRMGDTRLGVITHAAAPLAKSSEIASTIHSDPIGKPS